MKQTEAATELAPSVLVLTDFSDASRDALKWASHMCKQNHANLTVLYPYRLTQLNRGDYLPQLKKNIELEAQSNFTKLAESVFKDASTKYDFKAEVGFLNDRIYSYTRKNEVLLVVISKRMANANKEALDELLEHLRAPLLIVPQDELSNSEADRNSNP